MSLQDQLRKAGLVKEKQVKNVQKRQHAEDVRRRNTAERVPDPMKVIAQQQLAEKAERDRALNQQREEKLKARALTAEIRQLIDTNRVARGSGDIAHNFVFGKKIKKLYVNAEQRDALVAGRLVVIVSGEQFDLVPADIASKIAERDPSRVATQKRDASSAEDDAYYAKFQVPDDLDW